MSGRLIYNDEWYLDVTPTETPAVGADPELAAFEFTLCAAYPYWQSVTLRDTHVAGLNALFIFPWDFGEAFKFSERLASAFANVYNGGAAAAPFKAVFRAVSRVTNPSIIKTNTLEFVKINRVMNEGDVITVENDNERITVTLDRNGAVSDIFAWTDVNSTFFLLDKGDNIVKYDADEHVAGLDVRMFNRDAVPGV